MGKLRTFIALFMILLVAGMAGCATSADVRENLAGAEIAYASVADLAVSLREQGHIEPGSHTEEQITSGLTGANDALQAAHDLIIAGEDLAAQDRVAQARSMLGIVHSLLQEIARE